MTWRKERGSVWTQGNSNHLWRFSASQKGWQKAFAVLILCHSFPSFGLESHASLNKDEHAPSEAIEQMKTSAEKIGKEFYGMGLVYYKGLDGSKPDYQAAMMWFLRAAEYNYASAQCMIGYLHEKGLGVKQDTSEALRWYKKAAEQGNKDALDAMSRLAR